jgi:hypothetical protein
MMPNTKKETSENDLEDYLKPCPFCGQYLYLATSIGPIYQGSIMFHPQTKLTELCTIGDRGIVNTPEARNAWNIRANDKATEGPLPLKKLGPGYYIEPGHPLSVAPHYMTERRHQFAASYNGLERRRLYPRW